MLRLPPKVVGILCLLQVLAIVLGYVLTRSQYKLLESSNPELVRYLPPLAWYTKLMLSMGPWLLILPLVWGCIATASADPDGGIAEVSRRQVLIGYALSLCVALFCVGSVAQMMIVVWSPIR